MGVQQVQGGKRQSLTQLHLRELELKRDALFLAHRGHKLSFGSLPILTDCCRRLRFLARRSIYLVRYIEVKRVRIHHFSLLAKNFCDHFSDYYAQQLFVNA